MHEFVMMSTACCILRSIPCCTISRAPALSLGVVGAAAWLGGPDAAQGGAAGTAADGLRLLHRGGAAAPAY